MSCKRTWSRSPLHLSFLDLLAVLVTVPWGRANDDLLQMKFNEVKEIAPGVYFRCSSISASDKNVPFGPPPFLSSV